MSAIQRIFIEGVRVDFVKPAIRASFPRILFVHGMWGNSDLFGKWLEFCFAHGIEAYAINLKPGDNVSIDDYARSVREVVEEIGPVVLVGHSMSGIVVGMAAAKNPKVVAVVRLMGAAAKGTKGRFLKSSFFWFRCWDYVLAMITKRMFRLRKNHALKHVLNNTPDAEKNFESFGPESGLVLREIALGVKIEPISCPTLVVGGEYDKILPLDLQRKIASGSKLIVAKTGHMVQLEDRGNHVLRQILNWIRDNIRQEAAA